MGKHIDQSLKIRDNAQRALGEMYRTARHFGMNHAEILKRRSEILDRCGVMGAPHWVSSYLDGYWKCLMDYAYQQDLVFGGMIGETFYSTHYDRPDYYERHGISPCDYSDDGRVQRRGHYWRESLKPFFAREQDGTWK